MFSIISTIKLYTLHPFRLTPTCKPPLLQSVQFRVHRCPPEFLSPDHEHNHPDGGEANSESHHRHDWWNESVFCGPVIVVKDHAELYLSVPSFRVTLR